MIIFCTWYAVKTAISHHIAINTEADNDMLGGCTCIPTGNILQRADRYSAIDDSKSLLELVNSIICVCIFFIFFGGNLRISQVRYKHHLSGSIIKKT